MPVCIARLDCWSHARPCITCQLPCAASLIMHTDPRAFPYLPSLAGGAQPGPDHRPGGGGGAAQHLRQLGARDGKVGGAMPCRVLPYSCLAMPMPCHVMLCRVLPGRVLPCRVLPCSAIPCSFCHLSRHTERMTHAPSVLEWPAGGPPAWRCCPTQATRSRGPSSASGCCVEGASLSVVSHCNHGAWGLLANGSRALSSEVGLCLAC